MKTLRAGICAIGLACVMATPVSAVLINVDVNNHLGSPTFTGVGVLGGGFWNGIAGETDGSTTVLNLLDSTGAATGVDFLITGRFGFNNTLGGTPTTSELLQDYYFANTDFPTQSTVVVTLSGLPANTAFELVVYSAGDETNQGANFSGAITGSSSSVQRATLVEGENYVRGIASTDNLGELTFTATPQIQFAAVNGLQIQNVPEPTGATLLVVGVTAIAFNPRKRNRHKRRELAVR